MIKMWDGSLKNFNGINIKDQILSEKASFTEVEEIIDCYGDIYEISSSTLEFPTFIIGGKQKIPTTNEIQLVENLNNNCKIYINPINELKEYKKNINDNIIFLCKKHIPKQYITNIISKHNYFVCEIKKEVNFIIKRLNIQEKYFSFILNPCKYFYNDCNVLLYGE